ncbi:MAG: type II CRISPR-associated endonuclease Cas1 [Bacteroidales bacterium]|nr:type II CRISPR-associated endonuclease Cas1 [Bacteroidales bacterium]
MIKQTLYFSNPAILCLRNKQLLIRFPELEKHPEIKQFFCDKGEVTYHIPDIGMIILDHPQITITHALMIELMKHNVAIVTCDETHHPTGLLLTLHSNTLQNERYREQIAASEPLKKQLWSQLIRQKILNQASVLRKHHPSSNAEFLVKLSKQIKSGDTTNRESVAAAFYWPNLFPFIKGFVRHKEGIAPNNLLNYGYAILRACMARSIIEAGLLPTLGIHHHNRYNAYCLADDLMEPFRPFVDDVVYQIVINTNNPNELTKEIKYKLLSVLYIDCKICNETSPLQIATLRTARSLQQCFNGTIRKLHLPEFKIN